MSTTLATPRLPAAGTQVTVRMPDGYEASGRLIGLSLAAQPVIRIMGADRLERRIPAAGAKVSAGRTTD